MGLDKGLEKRSQPKAFLDNRTNYTYSSFLVLGVGFGKLYFFLRGTDSDVI